jgi:hypothetical protein
LSFSAKREREKERKKERKKESVFVCVSNQAPDLQIFRICTLFIHILEFVETGPMEKNRHGKIESAKNSNNNNNNSGSSIKEEDKTVC